MVQKNISSVQSLSHVQLFVTPWTAAYQASLSITNSRNLPKLKCWVWVNWVGDAIQPPHLLLSPSPPALNLSQNQGLFTWVSSSNQVAKVLDFQHHSFQWIFRVDILSVQFSRSVMSDSCDLHGQQHACFPVLHQLPELAQTNVHIKSVMPSDHLIFCCPLLLLLLLFPSIRVFSNESGLCIRWLKY